MITGNVQLYFTTFNEFRRVCREHFEAIFVQALKLCREAGLVKLRNVAIDGPKARANASKHKAMSCKRMLRAEVSRLLAKADATMHRRMPAMENRGSETNCPRNFADSRTGSCASERLWRCWRPRRARRGGMLNSEYVGSVQSHGGGALFQPTCWPTTSATRSTPRRGDRRGGFPLQ